MFVVEGINRLVDVRSQGKHHVLVVAFGGGVQPEQRKEQLTLSKGAFYE